ncbi:Fungal Zn2-Cys6 binuclear cluster domain-containing protein isoform 1 [Cladophialophora immunda]|nr:Fungal Zn2-Cys6 binuclear cluster domain-containing protein isoform 1 [Cladophialophora immunda]
MVFPSKGCANCLKRKIKCDQGRPACTQCVKADWSCPGYRPSVDLYFRDETKGVTRKYQSYRSRHPFISAPDGSSSRYSPISNALVSDDLPRGLNMDLKTRAVSFFFSQYVHHSLTSSEKFQPGSFEYLPSLYAQGDPDGPLVTIVHAAALASYANVGNVPSWTLESYRLCGLGILKCRLALGNPVEAKSDDVLASIMLLGFYETLALKGREAMKAWSQHMLGAAALIDFRGPSQFQDRSSIQMFLQIRRLIVLSAYQLQKPVPFSLKKWSTWLECANAGENCEVVHLANRLSEIVETLASVRSLIKASKTGEIGDILYMLLPIDNMLQSWQDQLPMSWRPVPHPACSFEDCSLHSHFEGRPFEVYPDLYIASLWNNYRGARILIHEMLLSTAISTSMTTVIDSKQLRTTINLLHQMSTEICLGVNYHLRPGPNVSSYKSSGHQIRLAPILAFSGLAQSAKLPVVDLGLDFYNFSNIRYARPPTGSLRFTAPQPPLTNRAVQNGSSGGTCPQSYPVWYLCGLALLSGSINSTDACDASLIPKPEPTEQEDCLFLDVIVPKQIFANASTKHATGAPVMVWVYGGGFTFSKKYQDGNPAGLIQRSREEDPSGKGVIYVTFNYRGGAFGFLSGPNVQSNGTANAGLLDQRMALQWVQQYIHLFGGDPKQITVFGQSAGAGSIMHQITAYAGSKGPAPFQRAILQSPGFEPFPSHWEQDNLLQKYLGLLNVSTIQEARELPFAALSAANVELVASSPYGTFTFAPAVDGDFVPSLPGNLLAQGNYDTSVQIMTGFNAHETLYFTDPDSTNNSVFLSSITGTFPGIQPSVADYVAQTLYPPIFNGSYPYSSFYERAELTLQDSAFTCNTFFLQTANREAKSIPAGYGLDIRSGIGV